MANRSTIATDARQASRHPVCLSAIVTSATGDALDATLIDLSVGGARVTLGKPIAFGVRMTIRFAVPTSPTAIEVDAIARWSDDIAVGFQFGSLRAIDMWALGKYVEQLEREP